MARRALLGLVLVTLAACSSPPPADITSIRFGPVIFERGVARSNQNLATDFLDLTFGLESGEKLERLLRYEGPVRVHVASTELLPYRSDIEGLIARLRTEAGIDIALTRDPQLAQIQIEAVPAAQLARLFPSAACFIIPGETSWRGFLANRGDRTLRWSAQSELRRAAIFLPTDTTPQDVRDCLHEELTQALGPANDLYRLPDSVWNDDNLHAIATPFDMLILRILYQPELRSGMTREAVADELEAIFDRENPKGRGLARPARHPESRAWAKAIEAALARGVARDSRVRSAALASQIAAEMRPTDHRLAVSLLTLGRLTLRSDPVQAARYFSEAYAVSTRKLGPDDLRTAHAGVHVAAVALAAGQYDTVVRLVDRHAPAALTGQNAILLAGLLSLKAEALLNLKDGPGARAARLDSLRWARYGFGDDDGALAREQAEIAEFLRIDGS